MKKNTHQNTHPALGQSPNVFMFIFFLSLRSGKCQNLQKKRFWALNFATRRRSLLAIVAMILLKTLRKDPSKQS